MPQLIRRAAPVAQSPNKGLGYLYASAGRATGEAEKRARQEQQSQQFTNFGLGLAGQAFGNYLSDRSFDHRAKVTADQQAALKAQDIEHRRMFLQELEDTNPDIVNHAAYQRLKPGVEQGLIKPQELPILMEAHDKNVAAQAAKETANSTNADYKNRMAGVAETRAFDYGRNVDSQVENRSGLLGINQQNADTRSGLLGNSIRNTDSLIDYRNNQSDLGQQKLAEAGRHNIVSELQGQQNADANTKRASYGKLTDDPEYRQASTAFRNSVQMGTMIQNRINSELKANPKADISYLEDALVTWHESALQADNALAQRGKTFAASRQSPSRPVVPTASQNAAQQVPREEQDAPKDKSSAIQDAFSELGPSATNEQIKSWLISHGY